MSKLGGTFFLECRNPDGSLAWRAEFHNALTTAGLSYVLGCAVAATTQITSWYIGLIDSSGFSTLAAADTMSSHTGWTESTAYDEAARQAWTPGAVASGAVTNASAAAAFTISAAGQIQGAFLNSVSTKSGTLGTLLATAENDEPLTVADNQVVSVVYPFALGGG